MRGLFVAVLAVLSGQIAPVTFAVVEVLAMQPAVAQSPPANWMKFLDKNGGYRDRKGGYYNPKAGTYTDEDGGVVDNWAGYIYNNGDYKSATGDFWRASTKSFELTNGEVIKQNMSNAEAVALMRETARDFGKFDKDFVQKSMIASIKAEHGLR